MDIGVTVHHVALQCRDRQGAVDFFTRVLGLQLVKSFFLSRELSAEIFNVDEKVEVLVFENQDVYFEVFISERLIDPGFTHVCVSVSDVELFLDRCKQVGVESFFVEKGGKQLLFVRDVDGNLFEIKKREG